VRVHASAAQAREDCALPSQRRVPDQGLGGAQLTVFNGAAGVSDVMAQLVGQGASILETVRDSLRQVDAAPVQPMLDLAVAD